MSKSSIVQIMLSFLRTIKSMIKQLKMAENKLPKLTNIVKERLLKGKQITNNLTRQTLEKTQQAIIATAKETRCSDSKNFFL